MSVSNSVSSFSPTAFFKDWPVSAIALSAGLSLGGTVLVIVNLRKTINDIGNSVVLKGIAKRVEIVFKAWCATLVLAVAGLVCRHPGFWILAVASSGVPIVVMLNIKWEIQKNSSSFQRNEHDKLERAVKDVFEIAIPAIALLTITLLLDSLDSRVVRN